MRKDSLLEVRTAVFRTANCSSNTSLAGSYSRLGLYASASRRRCIQPTLRARLRSDWVWRAARYQCEGEDNKPHQRSEDIDEKCVPSRLDAPRFA